MFSITIPTFNNLEYLKLCLKSINNNSKLKHQIIVHVNEGKDGTLEYIKSNKITHTFTAKNIGLTFNMYVLCVVWALSAFSLTKIMKKDD